MSVKNPLGDDTCLATLDARTEVVDCNPSFAKLFPGNPIGKTWSTLLHDNLNAATCAWIDEGEAIDTQLALLPQAKRDGISSICGYVLTPRGMVYSTVLTCAWQGEPEHYFIRVVVYDEVGPTSETTILSAEPNGEFRSSLGLGFNVAEWETLRDALSDPSITETARRLGITRKAVEYRLRSWAQRGGLKTPSELMRYLAGAYCRIGVRRGNTLGVNAEFSELTRARRKNHPAHRLPDEGN